MATVPGSRRDPQSNAAGSSANLLRGGLELTLSHGVHDRGANDVLGASHYKRNCMAWIDITPQFSRHLMAWSER
jgi:hypothetical protein